MAYVLLTGYSPFGGDTKQETYSNITNGKLEFGPEFDGISPSAIDFIKQLLVKRPEHRMTAKQCLEHCWLTESLENEIIESNFINTVKISTTQENDKENQAIDDYCADVIKEKTREYFILKMTQSNTSESKSLPSTPSCKRFILAGDEKNSNQSSTSERETQINDNNSNIYFESNSSISPFSSPSSFDRKPYHLVFCEDIRDERVSFIY